MSKGVLIINRNSETIDQCNDSFSRMWNFKTDELKGADGKAFIKLMESKLADPSILIDLLSAKLPIRVLELANQTRLEIYIENYISDNGTPLRIFIFSDVTLALKAKNDLKIQFNLLENIISAIPHSVFWKDTSSRYLGCNKRFAQDAGKSSPAEIVGKNDYDMPWSKAESDSFREYDQKIMSSGISELNIEETQQREGGEETVVLTSKVPLKNANNEVIGILGIYNNITEFKNAEKKIKDQELLLYSAAQLSSLGEMSSGIAHEINNPLSIIQTTATYLSKLIAREKFDVPQALDALNDITITVDRIAKIVIGLRNISRSTEGEKSPCCFADILGDVLGVAQERFKSHGVKIIENLPQDQMSLSFVANRIQLSQVIINLLNNSFDALLDLDDKDKWLELSITSHQKTIKFSITDSGKGISKDYATKIFNPFFTTKEIGKGTGIGLSISKSMVEKNGGSLYYDSRSENTRFVIELPYQD